ncbi:MAG: hypothetical protein ACRDVK_02290 [Acidimicrobiia bacterium]
MNYRIVLGAGVITLALLITGLALGGDSSIDGSNTVETTIKTESAEAAQTSARLSPVPLGALRILDGSSLPFAIGDAGTVIVGRFGDVLKIVSAEPKTDWTTEIRIPSGSQVNGVFWKAGIGVEYTFVLDEGVTRVRIEGIVKGSVGSGDHNESGSRNPATTTGAGTTQTAGPTTTPPATTTTTQAPTTPTTQPSTTTTERPTTTAPPTTTTTEGATTTTSAATTTTAEPPTTTVDAWTQVVLVSEGGSIIVSYRPEEVRLDAVFPAPTFVLEDVEEEPKRVEVELEGDDVTWTIEAKWANGEFVTDIEASGSGGD